MRSVRTVLAMVLVLLVAIAPGADAAKPRAAPKPQPTIQDAIDALARLDAFRFDVEATRSFLGVPAGSRGTVVRGPVWRREVEYLRGGETYGRTVVAGRRAWTSEHGSAYRRIKGRFDARHPGAPIDTHYSVTGPMPIARGVPGAVEERDGRAVRELVFTWPDLGPGPRSGFVGTAEVWLDVADGYLVESHLSGDVVLETYDGPPRRVPIEEHIRISAIDAPDLSVELPDLAPVKPDAFAAGDPGTAPLVLGARDRLDDLVSYRAIVPSPLPFLLSDTYLTVVNEPVPVVLVEEGPVGSALDRTLVTEHSWWTEDDEGAWLREQDAFYWDTCDDGYCSFSTVTDIGSDLADIASTFRVVVDSEIVNGIPSTHLRSDAGTEDLRAGWIPGTWDLWVAVEGGFLVRETFDGQAVGWTLDVSGVDDPANSLTIPGDS